MLLREHLDMDFRLFGTEFPEVHDELDRTAGVMPSNHRKDTHYLEYVISKFNAGEWDIGQCRSAIQHILDDCGVLMVKSDWESPADLGELYDG